MVLLQIWSSRPWLVDYSMAYEKLRYCPYEVVPGDEMKLESKRISWLLSPQESHLGVSYVRRTVYLAGNGISGNGLYLIGCLRHRNDLK